MRLLTATFVLCTLTAAAQGAEGICHERVIGPEFGRPYKHPATIAELANGDLYIAYYGGDGEYDGDTACYGMRKQPGCNCWSQPEVVADAPNRSEGNVAIWQAPDGLVWLFYVNNYGPTWCSARIKYKISKDGGHTWSDSDILSFEEGTMLRSAPILLNDGDYLLPVYHETGQDQERTAPDTCSYFLRYNPKKKAWTETNRIMSDTGNLQAQPVQIDDNYLIAYIRRGGGFDPDPTGVLYRSESRDGGKTWSRGERTQFPNPNAACDFIKLQNGHLLLVNNDNKTGQRMPLTVHISTDNDKTWPHKRDVVNKPGDSAGYPTAIQSRDGKIHVVYTSEKRQVINHIWFDESAILNQ